MPCQHVAPAGGLVLDGDSAHSEAQKSPLARQVPPKAVIGALRARAITLGRALIEHLCVSVLVLLEQPAELRSLGSLVGAGLLAVPLVDALRRVHHVAVPGVHHRSAELNLSHGDVASQALDPQQHGLALCSIVDVLEAGSGASGGAVTISGGDAKAQDGPAARSCETYPVQS